jgi:hypothetical protein
MRRGQWRARQPDLGDPADETVTSELGWARFDGDLRGQWIPCPLFLPDGHDGDWWATTAAAAWSAQWGLPAGNAEDAGNAEVERLTTMLKVIREGGMARVKCHQIWIYLPDPFTAPLPVFIAIWRQSGGLRRRLRRLTGADDRSAARKPRVARVTTERLGTGLRVLRLQALLGYAFRVEEHETDLQIFTGTSDQRALTAARGDIERLVQGITVYRAQGESAGMPDSG